MEKVNTATATFERLKRIPLNLKQLDYASIEVEDIIPADYPDFCDAFISYAEFLNGKPLTDDEIEQLNNERDIVYEAAFGSYF